MKWNKESPIRAELLLIKKHLKNLDGVNFWNKNEDNILVYIKNNIDVEMLRPDSFLDALLMLPDYRNEFRCMSISYRIDLVEKLINSGYIILSQKIFVSKKQYNSVLKLKKTRSYLSSFFMCAFIYKKYPILFLANLKEPKISIKRLNDYELKIDVDFDEIVDKCAEIHGDGWLTKPLRECFKKIHRNSIVKFISFGLYKNDKLKAGEFGVLIGGMYISYSGYHIESSAGTIQMIKMFRYLKTKEIICCNLFGTGEKMEYKYRFGAIDVNRNDYIKLFRELKNNQCGLEPVIKGNGIIGK